MILGREGVEVVSVEVKEGGEVFLSYRDIWDIFFFVISGFAEVEGRSFYVEYEVF